MSSAIFRKRLLLQAALMLALAFSGCLCEYDPYARQFTTTKPLSADCVGTYTLTEQTITDDGLTILHGQLCQIVLQADGACQITNYPEWDGADQLNGLVTATGQWQVVMCGTVAVTSNDPGQTAWGISFTTPKTGDRLTLTNQTPPHGLIHTEGDPDAARVMIFQRKP
ncbi:MAG TPA: hypothetical protein VL860_04350 [Planctomycetota bacterium]|nr:hypothetical protein [Planctomycetota bacterium]